MKKNLFIILSLFAVSLAWCTTSNNQSTNIDSLEWEQLFNNQIEDFQYIKDFEDFISYNVLSITEDKPYNSDFSFSAKFDENSSVQWWVEFSQKKNSKSHNLESSDIKFSVKAENSENDAEPFDLSWNISLLYKDNELYANLHSLNVFMWEWNMTAKMYTLLWDLIIDKRVDLEVHNGWIVSIDETDNKTLPHIVWSIENILKTEDIESSPNFLSSLAEIIDTINSYINLWISTNELTTLDYEISYNKLSDKVIHKHFTWSFQWKDSAFNLWFIASKNWIEIHIYNIKEFDEDIADYKDTDTEFLLWIKENKKSEYSINFESIKSQQKIADLEWELQYTNGIKFSADFTLEPLEITIWQKISWKLNWNIIKKWGLEKEIPELSEDILSLNELLSSL